MVFSQTFCVILLCLHIFCLTRFLPTYFGFCFCRVCVSFGFFFLERERAWNWADGGVEELEEGKSMLRIYYMKKIFPVKKRKAKKRKKKSNKFKGKKANKGKGMSSF